MCMPTCDDAMSLTSESPHPASSADLITYRQRKRFSRVAAFRVAVGFRSHCASPAKTQNANSDAVRRGERSTVDMVVEGQVAVVESSAGPWQPSGGIKDYLSNVLNRSGASIDLSNPTVICIALRRVLAALDSSRVSTMGKLERCTTTPTSESSLQPATGWRYFGQPLRRRVAITADQLVSISSRTILKPPPHTSAHFTNEDEKQATPWPEVCTR